MLLLIPHNLSLFPLPAQTARCKHEQLAQSPQSGRQTVAPWRKPGERSPQCAAQPASSGERVLLPNSSLPKLAAEQAREEVCGQIFRHHRWPGFPGPLLWNLGIPSNPTFFRSRIPITFSLELDWPVGDVADGTEISSCKCLIVVYGCPDRHSSTCGGPT
jgi:hypothetical protein